MSFDVIATVVALAVALAWAGHRVWRAVQSSRNSEPVAGSCGGGCNGCPIGDKPPVGGVCEAPESRD